MLLVVLAVVVFFYLRRRGKSGGGNLPDGIDLPPYSRVPEYDGQPVSPIRPTGATPPPNPNVSPVSLA